MELLHGDEDAQRVAGTTVTLAELLARRNRTPPHIAGHALVQTHRHHAAVLGTTADRAILGRAGVDAEFLDSGCCGLAGNFGFERGHYDVSIACGERVLLPAVRAAPDTTLLADGFSCRLQIEQATGRHAVHLAEALCRGLGDPDRVRSGCRSTPA